MSEKGEMVILTKEDLACLPVELNHEIEVTEFVPADQADPVAFDNAYVLKPASRCSRAYVQMWDAHKLVLDATMSRSDAESFIAW